MTKQAERIAVLDAITRELGGTVIKRAETEYTDHDPMAWQNISLPEGCISLHYHGDRKGDYIHVSGDWPRDRKGSMVMARDVEYNTASPSINVGAAKSPEAIARDIRRRFLPEYARLYAKAMAIIASRDQYEATVADNYRLLAAACGGSVAKSSWQDAWVLKGLPEGVEITHVGDDSIRLELTCSVGMACEILRQRATVTA